MNNQRHKQQQQQCKQPLISVMQAALQSFQLVSQCKQFANSIVIIIISSSFWATSSADLKINKRGRPLCHLLALCYLIISVFFFFHSFQIILLTFFGGWLWLLLTDSMSSCLIFSFRSLDSYCCCYYCMGLTAVVFSFFISWFLLLFFEHRNNNMQHGY